MARLNETRADRLRFARSVKGLTQKKLSKFSGVSIGCIGKIERSFDATKPVSKDKIKMLCNTLGITIDWLEYGIEPVDLADNYDNYLPVSKAYKIFSKLSDDEFESIKHMIIRHDSYIISEKNNIQCDLEEDDLEEYEQSNLEENEEDNLEENEEDNLEENIQDKLKEYEKDDLEDGQNTLIIEKSQDTLKNSNSQNTPRYNNSYGSSTDSKFEDGEQISLQRLFPDLFGNNVLDKTMYTSILQEIFKECTQENELQVIKILLNDNLSYIRKHFLEDIEELNHKTIDKDTYIFLTITYELLRWNLEQMLVEKNIIKIRLKDKTYCFYHIEK